MAFKSCIHGKDKPRGYMKILDRNGNAVSSLLVNKKERSVCITHKNREFSLKMDTAKSYQEWLQTFTALGIQIDFVSNDINDEKQQQKMIKADDEQTKNKKKLPKQQQQQMNVDENEENMNNINYDEEDERLLAESQRLEQLLKKDQSNILKSFADIRQSIAKTDA